MKVFHIPKVNNNGIRRILLLEHAREESLTFIQTVANIVNSPFIWEAVQTNMVNAFNSVILDNLLRFVNTKDSLSLVMGMQNNTLGLMMEVAHRHYSELITEEFAFVQRSHLIEQQVRAAMAEYINYVYLNNKEDMDAAILELYEVLYSNFGHMEITHHRFVYMNGGRPAAIITGELNATGQAY